MSDALPPVQDYPGYFPPKPPFWTRAKVGAASAALAGVLGLLVGLLMGGDGATAAPGARGPSSTVTVTASPDAPGPTPDTAAVTQVRQRLVEVEKLREADVLAAKARARRQLRSALAAARSRQKRAVAAAVAGAVVRERRSADSRVAAAKSAARSVAAAAPSGGGGGGTDPRFSYCYEANDAGYGPYRRGQDPEYAWYSDNDGDGEVCE